MPKVGPELAARGASGNVTFLPTGQDFLLDGVTFKVLIGDYRARVTDEEGVVLLKPWDFAERQLRELDGLKVSRMLELGIWQGGSAVLWSLIFPLERYVGIDIADVAIDFPSAVTTNPRWEAVRLHGKVSQDDRVALNRIIREDFSDDLDLIVDDASHQYLLSRASFHICFPHLRRGGVYILEDWAWAHWPGKRQESDHPWADSPALSNLVLELVLLSASRPDVISRIVVTSGFVVVTRGSAELPEPFDVTAMTLMRGRKLSFI